MSKFTPGEWTIEHFDEFDSDLLVGPEWDIIYDKDGNGTYGIDFTNKADMKLISKAPEMYTLIKEMKNILLTVYREDESANLKKMMDDTINSAQTLLLEIDAE